MSTEPLEYRFDEEIMVSDDRTKLEGYVWAMSSLVERLKEQEPPLNEDQSMENINFYPVYDISNHTVSLEGHYYLEDGFHATGKGFCLPLDEEEASRLIDAFEAYCQKREGMSCLTYLNEIRLEEGLPPLPNKSLDAQIQAAFSRSAGYSSTYNQVCRVTFCRTTGAADHHQFEVDLNITPKDYRDGQEELLLDVDERIKAYEKAAEKVGEDVLVDYIILSAQMVMNQPDIGQALNASEHEL